MPTENHLLRSIPKIDDLLATPALALAAETHGHSAAADAARRAADEVRADVLSGALAAVPDAETLAGVAVDLLQQASQPHLRRVVNATGIILHTNLGRAPLAAAAVDAVADAARGYSTLEYDLDTAKRGSRHSHVDALLCALTGAEAAMVVNNNAAAVLLALAAVAKDKEVVVSRGELVEIGGSFRVPDIMALSGAVLREVGATNRTHPADYEAAINESTGALFKAHRSNFRQTGFVGEVELADMVDIGRRHGLPVIYDLGGGGLYRWQAAAVPGEPSVEDCVAAGADLITFSGDKLLGGPQAGIVLGTKALVEALKKHPLTRAMRVDKLTLAALEATLKLYRDEALAKREVPTLAMLFAPPDALRGKAQRLHTMLPFFGAHATVVAEEGQLGAGSAPMLALDSFAVAVTFKPQQLEEALRASDPPVIARISHDRLLLDARTVDEADFPLVANCLKAAWERLSAEA